jgi:hypothetical protein
MMRPFRAEDAMADPAMLNTLQFLAWVARERRTYGDVRQAWRSTCPRLSAWEDALDQALIEFERGAGRVGDATPVRLTARGRRLLAQ